MSRTKVIIEKHLSDIRRAIINCLIEEKYSDIEISKIMSIDRTWVHRIRKQNSVIVPKA